MDPRDRELLSLSLRRRVPDEALGRLYECSPSDVARQPRAGDRAAGRRDGAAARRGPRRGAQGAARAGAPGPRLPPRSARSSPRAAAARGSRRCRCPDEDDEPQVEAAPTPALAPVPPPPDTEPASAPARGAARARAAAERAGPRPAPDPVELEMVAEREREAPDPPRRAVPIALIGLGIAALIGAAGVIGATQFGDSERVVPRRATAAATARATSSPRRGGRWRRRSRPSRATDACYSTAAVRTLDRALPRARRRKRLRITP